MENVIEKTAATGIESLFQLGAVVTVLILVILGGYILFKKAIEQCERREERAISNWEKANDRSVTAYEKAVDSMNGVQIALTRLEAKLDK